MMKSRRMKYAEHVARMGEKKKSNVGGWTVLKWILERWDGMVWIGLTRLRVGASGGLL
jgi:hypothetical protein